MAASEAIVYVVPFECETLETFGLEFGVFGFHSPLDLRVRERLAEKVAGRKRNFHFLFGAEHSFGIQGDLEGAGLEILHQKSVGELLRAEAQTCPMIAPVSGSERDFDGPGAGRAERHVGLEELPSAGVQARHGAGQPQRDAQARIGPIPDQRF